MKRIAFLSADDLEGYVIDDQLCYEPLRELGWLAETVSWRNARVDWSKFECAIIRSTWDYQKDLPAFLAALARVSAATRLINPLVVVRWNADKIYLRELAERGARIVPTIWGEGKITPNELSRWREELGSDELVIKPTVSANAQNTVRVCEGESARDALAVFSDRPYLVQPFVNSIVTEGEFSLFYFGGAYSHSVLKTPKAQDFRVQEEHGGVIRATRATPELLEAGATILRLLGQPLLYARIDFVRVDDGFALMELELIEPSLYLRMDEGAPSRLAGAIDRWLATAR